MKKPIEFNNNQGLPLIPSLESLNSRHAPVKVVITSLRDKDSFLLQNERKMIPKPRELAGDQESTKSTESIVSLEEEVINTQ